MDLASIIELQNALAQLRQLRDEKAELEQQVASTMPVFARGLTRYGLRQQRRALRLLAADLRWSFTAPRVLALHFSLPAGAFATSVLRELVGVR